MGSLPNLRAVIIEYSLDDVKNQFRSGLRGAKNDIRVSTRARPKLVHQSKSLQGYYPGQFYSKKTADTPPPPPLHRLPSSRTFKQSRTTHHGCNNAPVKHHSHGMCSRQTSLISEGSSSVHKLIGVVRSTPSKVGTVYTRSLICQNFIALCLTHGIFTVAYVPIIVLQTSTSIWSANLGMENAGSILFSMLYFLSSVVAVFSPYVSNKIGTAKTLLASYGIATLFVAAHFYLKPSIMIPAYALMSLATGNLGCCRMTYMMALASKLKYVLSDEEENEFQRRLESTKRDALVRKLYRGVMFAQNAGLIAAAVFTHMLLQNVYKKPKIHKNDDFEERCGFASCPSVISYNSSEMEVSGTLTWAFIGCCFLCMTFVAFFIHRVRLKFGREKWKFEKYTKHVKDVFTDFQLNCTAPLSFFIGLGHGFIFADFTKFYVICVLGIENASLVFIGLGILQSIAAFTLSLVISHVRRYILVVLGFIFQGCLLLVLILWKPKNDDAALFYVISATWGVCNAIWDTLLFCLILTLFRNQLEFPLCHSYFFKYLGLSAAFAMHGYICTRTKLYILVLALFVAVIPYGWIEIKAESKYRIKISSTRVSRKD